jgi:hypothetical protein
VREPSETLVSTIWCRSALICAFFGSVACDRDARDSETPDAGGGCADTARVDPTDYVPSDARGLVSLRVEDLVDFEREVVGRSSLVETDYASVLDVMATCGMTIDSVRSLTVAAGSDEDEVIAVVEGDRLGDESRLRCLEVELGARSLVDDTAIERHGCDVRIVHEGETVGFAAGPDTLVIATPRWLGHARSVSLGARPTPPRRLVRKLEERRTVWFGGDLQDYTAQLERLPLVGGLQTVVGWIDLDSGFELEVEGTYDSREAASTVAHELEALRRRGRMLAPELGIPPRLLDRVAVKHRGRDVRITIDLSKSDVRRLSDALGSRRG